eukprot:5569279-Pleurochrysis_carterae.AAC.3
MPWGVRPPRNGSQTRKRSQGARAARRLESSVRADLWVNGMGKGVCSARYLRALSEQEAVIAYTLANARVRLRVRVC